MISLQTSVIKTTSLSGYWVQYGRFGFFSALLVRSSSVGEKQCYQVTGVRRLLEMFLCLPSAASHLSVATLCLLSSSQSYFLRDFHHFPNRGTLNPFVCLNTLDSPSLSQKSEKGPINLTDHYFNLSTHRGHGQ